MDGEGWHTNDIAEPFDNVSIIKLPPYSPELNPIEQVWSGLRQHYLANTSFADYESIVSKVCRAWKSFWGMFGQSQTGVLEKMDRPDS